MEYLQYTDTTPAFVTISVVLNLVISGIPSILKTKLKELKNLLKF